jgi:hypothetical protein
MYMSELPSEYPFDYVMPMDPDQWSIMEHSYALDPDGTTLEDIEHFLRVSAALQAGEGPEIPLPVASPGNDRSNLGIAAYDTLLDLCEEAPRWTEDKRWWWTCADTSSLHNWHDLERHIPGTQAELGAESDVEDLNEVLLRLHGALPFDEVEREWVYQAYDESRGPNSITLMRRREAAIVSGGLRRVLQGRDLMRRWWSWRRETDEYSGQGSLDIARDTLAELVVAYCNDPEVPEPYLALRGAEG